MSVPFRGAAAASTIQYRPLVARITARHYARLRTYLEAEALRQGLDLLRQKEGDEHALDYALSARVDTLALAALARLFDYDADVIAVLDEAQLTRAQIRTRRLPMSGDILLEIGEEGGVDGAGMNAPEPADQDAAR
ncbi:hypothetical protein Swit_5228 (plasmid) [Rhizorhabdus wittichii RW1]|uniref:Uncharacterized protein n=1 Tax=Rhizorhabdus wittichii (strain DSM 6014 / CCUG 31198 / JCM 15750 / NBRC 105917 / EY 4224 / RW1) TaxID=392499 RepID=A0A9J9HH46_RHIWR|nr:hypothetical protein [Rhizorhabdus sp.]ABQ71337.1 hypothetical protein Swit_5228 [Rhizorhabdus wittichii RW1]MBD3761395.1 hypothetical protein [Rhizorhabdus sp.]